MKIIVTGAAGGLGKSLCKEAFLRGWDVIGVDVATADDEVKAMMDTERMEYYTCDMGDLSQVAELAGRIREKESALDGIVNNVGVVLGREAVLESLNLNDVRRSMEINVYGPMTLTQGLLPLLRRSKRAGIVNISSSAAAIKGTREIDYPYAMSKCALNMFTEKLRVYLERDHIAVAAVHPGWMRTALGGDNASVSPSEVAVHVLDILCGKQPVTAVPAFVNRFGEPVLDRNEI